MTAAQAQYRSAHGTQMFQVDNLLPAETARAIYDSFPRSNEMRERKTLRKHKCVAAQMDRYDAQAEAALFAFNDERVIAKVAQVIGMEHLYADAKLYAGRLSLVTKGDFLNPHLDKSHNSERTLYRVLNVLYYVSPDWDLNSGGHLELWPQGVRGKPRVVSGLFNHLVVMETGPDSWHSVSRVQKDAPRCCISNSYFNEQPVGGDQPNFKAPRFRGRPEPSLRSLLIQVDGMAHKAFCKLRPHGAVQTTHIYRRPDRRDQ